MDYCWRLRGAVAGTATTMARLRYINVFDDNPAICCTKTRSDSVTVRIKSQKSRIPVCFYMCDVPNALMNTIYIRYFVMTSQMSCLGITPSLSLNLYSVIIQQQTQCIFVVGLGDNANG